MDLAAERRDGSNATVLAALIATGAMLFTTFTASYLIRRTGADWTPVSMPGVVWAGTAVIAASSAAVEVARRRRSRAWIAATLALGVAFLALQLVAWRALAARGLFLPTTPHASFFYLLSAVHGAHVVAGLAALAAALRAARVDLAATWWHFVGGAWVYVLAMLTVL
jgi:cytochrome c oxidase subunit 3